MFAATRSAVRRAQERSTPRSSPTRSPATSKYFTKSIDGGWGGSKRRKTNDEAMEVDGDTFSLPGDGQHDTNKSATNTNDAHWCPPRWEEQLKNIYEMRKNRDAPVDVMGCDRLMDPDASPKIYRYQILLSLMLSSQTKDQVTSAAMVKLRQHGCNLDNILATSNETLEQLICPVGFYKRKAEYIKRTSQILKAEYKGDIPDCVEDLCKLPGVGPKMAYLVMKSAWNKIVGIGVDVHVHRISNRLRWVKKPTSDPEKTRKDLEDWLPRHYWQDINCLLVGFGQQTCLPVNPKCSECINNKICPSAFKAK